MTKNVIEEFVLILEHYMDYYGLYNVDVKNLLTTSTDIVKDIKAAKNGPTLKKLESIAQLFGLNYYQFGNPDFALPEKKDLPKATQEKIAWRAEVGPPDSKQYNKLDLNNAVLKQLKIFEGKEFLASEIFETLSPELKEKLRSATRITGLFSDELKDNVKKTGKKLDKNGVGRKQEYYRVVSLKGRPKGKK
ncbi:hypothetical protein ABTW24_24445 [Sphingobacterium thalpophilum]|uniref:HTH cro/C1-type domain-containing protein n=1 Tax=Sphingobacterium thalpophilum TaxID=259 RepID=A0ABV4HJQ7_9SPHI